MLKSFALKNVKSFNENSFEKIGGSIELAPLTLFVGQNSCGKSSLIRFPLVLSQTNKELVKLVTATKGISTPNFPLALCGDLIDYGDFHDVSFNHESKPIEFTLKGELDTIRRGFEILPNVNNNYVAKFAVVEEKGNLVLDSLELELGGMNVCSVNREAGNSYKLHVQELYDIYELKSYEDDITDLEGLRDKLYDVGPFDAYPLELEQKLSSCGYDPEDSYLYEQIESDFRNRKSIYEPVVKLNFNTDISVTIDSYQGFFPVMSYNDISVSKEEEDPERIKILKKYEKIDPSLKQNLKRLIEKKYFRILYYFDQKSEQEKIENEINDVINSNKELLKEEFADDKLKLQYGRRDLFEEIVDLFDRIGLEITQKISDVGYIAPFRNNPERIYRKQGLYNSNVGTRGENMATVLSNLKASGKLDAISYWTKKILGYTVDVDERVSGYCQIVLVDKNNIKSNIIDTGYGVSQLLPIILQLCIAMENKEEGSTLVIEQPELHLHPNAQTELADLFVECVTKYNMCIFCETHSEHFIRKLQVLIAKKDNEFTNKDLKIYYVDKDAEGVSSVDEMVVQENGKFASEWPSGFFDKAYDLTVDLLRAIKNSKR